MITRSICNIESFILLFADKKPVDDKPDIFLVAENNNLGVCRIHLENSSSTDYYAGKQNATDNDREIRISGLHYDAHNNTIFYLASTMKSSTNLYATRVNDSYRKLIFDQDNVSKFGESYQFLLLMYTAYDWAANNMYLNFHHFLGVINFESPWNMSITLDKRKDISDITLHPNKGYIYFVDQPSDQNSGEIIYRAYLDGSNVVEFEGTKCDKYIVNIAVDFFGDKLYWYVPHAETIRFSSLDGQDIHTVNNMRIYFDAFSAASRTFALDKNYVYYRSADKNSVRRFSKQTFLEDKDYELFNGDNGQIKEIMIYTNASQRVRDDHPCKIRNGRCEKYCFAVPEGDALKRVCGCSLLEHLAPDGISCIEGAN